MRIVKQAQKQPKKGVMNFKIAHGSGLKYFLKISDKVNVADMRFQMLVKPAFEQGFFAQVNTYRNGVLIDVPELMTKGRWRNARYEIVMSYGNYSKTVLQGQILIK